MRLVYDRLALGVGSLNSQLSGMLEAFAESVIALEEDAASRLPADHSIPVSHGLGALIARDCAVIHPIATSA